MSVDGTVSLRAIRQTVGTYPTRPRTPDPAAGSTQMPTEANPRTMLTQLVEKLHVQDRSETAASPLADEEQALGMLELGGPLLGMRTRRAADGVMGLAWSHSQCVKVRIFLVICLSLNGDAGLHMQKKRFSNSLRTGFGWFR
jgi:hypothetical protein